MESQLQIDKVYPITEEEIPDYVLHFTFDIDDSDGDCQKQEKEMIKFSDSIKMLMALVDKQPKKDCVASR